MTIAVDFDGTIVEHRYPAIGKERPFAVATLRQLQKEQPDLRLILWTVREGQLLEDAVRWCSDHDLHFFAVNSNYPGELPVAAASAPGAPDGTGVVPVPGCRKVTADLYIDDRQLGGLPSWPEIYRRLSGKHPSSSASADTAAQKETPSFLGRLFGKR